MIHFNNTTKRNIKCSINTKNDCIIVYDFQSKRNIQKKLNNIKNNEIIVYDQILGRNRKIIL